MRCIKAMMSEQIERISYTRKLNGPITSLVEQLSKELGTRGFGILSSIDLQKRIKEKLGEDIEGGVILEVCNTKHAKRALDAHREVLLALPCKIVVYERAEKILVSLYKPTESIKQLGFPDLYPLAEQVERELKEAIDALAPA